MAGQCRGPAIGPYAQRGWASCDRIAVKLRDRCLLNEATFADASGADGRTPEVA
jgi:hypothetical protein